MLSAAINSYGLFSNKLKIMAAAEQFATSGPHTPNPFLYDFYVSAASENNESVYRTEHVVFLYESIAARAPAETLIDMTIEGEQDNDLATVEIELRAPGKEPRSLTFKTVQAGELRFSRKLEAVDIEAPHIDVQLGQGKAFEIIAPVTLSVSKIRINSPELAVSVREKRTEINTDDTAFLEAVS